MNREVSEITIHYLLKKMLEEHYCWGCKESNLTLLDFSEISSFYGLCMKCLLDGKLKGKKIIFLCLLPLVQLRVDIT